MEITELENRLKKITEDINKETFIYDLLLAYDFPKATISRIKSGDLNLSKNPNEILFKKKLLFKTIENKDLHDSIDELSNDKQIAKYEPRLIIVTDFNILLAQDTQTKDTLDIKLEDLFKYSNFFFPWIGKEKIYYKNENIVDIKAATKMGQLYDSLILENHNLNQSEDGKHALNIFFARLLFCLFAEDTNIFEGNLFTNALANHSKDDGSDLQEFFKQIFLALNKRDNSDAAEHLKNFPHVNGGLFKESFFIPVFSRKSRQIIIEAGQLDWAGINPDIFGSMVQAIADPNERASFGVHYTSVSNILKVINPLFMDKFRSMFLIYKKEKDLENILNEIYNLKIFDPACGSGNFLIVAYRELSLFEIKIFEELQSINPSKWSIARSGIRLNQFYGITINDFDAEVAKLSLWLSEHQMNLSFKNVFGSSKPTLPLSEAGKIICHNSLNINWSEVCLNDKGTQIYVVGNPPYVGSSMQTEFHKSDMAKVFRDFKNYKNLDYIACWFYLGSKYIMETNAELAFVTTNSLVQGELVSLLWGPILELGIELSFAYKSFKWTNNAKNKAGVSCVILGLRKVNNSKKFIYEASIVKEVKNITPYLTEGKFVNLHRRSKPVNDFPKMLWGNKPTDDGNLILEKREMDLIINGYPEASKYIKKYSGSNELINGIERWCIWISDNDKDEALKIPPIKDRADKVRAFREKSKAASTRAASKTGYKFIQIQSQPKHALLIPTISSESREYIPIGYVEDDTVVNSASYAIYNCPIYIFAILTSKIHMIWVNCVAGRLETRLRYSSALCYESFPFPEIDDRIKRELEDFGLKILDIREKYSERTLAGLYDNNLMPNDLRDAHRKLDNKVYEIYNLSKTLKDEDVLEFLFDMYEKMDKESLF
jgi:type II restriction/modification system DNA methylase subunit YeeA